MYESDCVVTHSAINLGIIWGESSRAFADRWPIWRTHKWMFSDFGPLAISGLVSGILLPLICEISPHCTLSDSTLESIFLFQENI